MKALSIQQPWAYLITRLTKDIENRDWTTPYRGTIAIHAGKTPDLTFFPDGKTLDMIYAVQVCGGKIASVLPERIEQYDRGGIVGYATLKDVVTQSDSRWFRGRYGFVLSQRHPVDLIPVRGQLLLFDLPERIAEQVAAIRDERAEQEDANDFNRIEREWDDYAHEGDEVPDPRRWDERIS